MIEILKCPFQINNNDVNQSIDKSSSWMTGNNKYIKYKVHKNCEKRLKNHDWYENQIHYDLFQNNKLGNKTFK
jgi:hypothetical protein